jgi:hypothetical protein
MMRAALATVAAALVAATPAGAITIDKSVSLAQSIPLPQAQTSRDKTRSCQVGSRRKVILKSKHPQVVACEQPPRANLLGPDAIAKATAALAAIG